MIDKKKYRSSPSPYLTLKTEPSVPTFSNNRGTEIEQLYSSIETEEGSRQPLDRNLFKSSRFAIQQRPTQRTTYFRAFKTPIEDRRTFISNDQCSDCESYVRTIEELKQEIKEVTERCLATERHLKQYDNLLQIKDNRLNQQEITLKAEADALETEKEKAAFEMRKVQEAKAELKKQQEYLDYQTNEIEERFNEISEKENELNGLLQEINLKNEDIMIREAELAEIEQKYCRSENFYGENEVQHTIYESSELQATEIKQHFEDIQREKENLQEKHEELERFAESLANLKKSIENEKKIQFEQIEAREQALANDMEKLFDEKENLKFAQMQMAEGIESVEILKGILATQQENLEKERDLMKEDYQQRLLQLEDAKRKIINTKPAEFFGKSCDLEDSRSFQNALKVCEDLLSAAKQEIDTLEKKNAILELSQEEILKHCSELEQRLTKTLTKKQLYKEKSKKLEAIISTSSDSEAKQNYQRVNTKNIELSSKVQKLESQLTDLSKKLANEVKKNDEATKEIQRLKLGLGSYDDPSDFYREKMTELAKDLELNLENVRVKEKELEALQEMVLEEKKSINAASEYVKAINDDLANQQLILAKEKEELAAEKRVMLELQSKHQEKDRALLQKHAELLEFHEKLMAREKELSIAASQISKSPQRDLDIY